MSKKQRIYLVAKEYHISNEALIEFLSGHGHKVRNHMAPLSDEMLELVSKHFVKTESPEEPESDIRKKILAKKEKEEAHKEAIRQEIDEVLELSKRTDLPKRIEKPKKVKKIQVEKKADEIITEPVVEVSEANQDKPIAITTEEIVIKGAELRSEKSKTESEPSSEKKSKATSSKDTETTQDRPKRHLKKRPMKDDENDEFQLKRQKGRKQSTIADLKAKVESGEEPDRKKKRRKKKKKAVQIDEKEIAASIKSTLAKMDDSGKKKRRKKDRVADELDAEDIGNVIHTTEFISAAELANLLDVEPSEVIQACMSLGLMVSINQRLEKDTILMVADDFDYDVEFITEYGEEEIEHVEEVDSPEDLHPRPPVVTIMGHVDHGKTSLLDYIRKSNIIAGESGGITQHIGAYEVSLNGKQITFLDTPGHEAFTAMRARGAQVTDIVVLVVAADDNVMPQTMEAINHARAAGVPMVVAVNKVDKSNANPESIRKQLADKDVLLEDWGGKVQSQEISAKTGQGIEDLLEKIILEAEILELKANPNTKARGILIETQMERGRGIVSTVLIQRGTLRIGDIYVAGQFNGRVRAMFDERNNPVEKAGPSTPVLILGFSGMPQAGDHLTVVDSEQEAKEISLKRQQLRREQSFRQHRRLTLDQISKQIAEGVVKELHLIIKADVDGSMEALSDSLMELGNEDVSVRIIHKGVGAITETDVNLAETSQAVIIGFHVAPTVKARELAQQQEVDIRGYRVIYDVVNDVKLALSGMLEPEKTEEVVGALEVRNVFKASKVGNIGGCHVTFGKVNRNNMIRLLRDGTIIFEGKLSSLKRFKDDVKEVAAGYECGATIENYNDIKVGDVIESYHIVETARSL